MTVILETPKQYFTSRLTAWSEGVSPVSGACEPFAASPTTGAWA